MRAARYKAVVTARWVPLKTGRTLPSEQTRYCRRLWKIALVSETAEQVAAVSWLCLVTREWTMLLQPRLLASALETQQTRCHSA